MYLFTYEQKVVPLKLNLEGQTLAQPICNNILVNT